jgi:hypothetical protein
MPDKQHWKSVRSTASAELRPGERLLAICPALTPRDSGGGLAVSGAWPLIMVVEHLAWRRRAGVAGRTSGFPLAPRMIIGVTDQRLVTWAARRGWRLGPVVGDVSRDLILQATAPTVGAGWRTVLIRLSSGPTVRIKVPANLADRLAAGLSGSPGELAGSAEPA